MTESLIGLAGMLVLSFLRVPIAISMGLVGFLGLWWMRGARARRWRRRRPWSTRPASQYTLSVVPLFILMGNFVTRAGMSKELYRAAYTFVGHLRGGLAMSTVLACAGFGAICGSSIATAATMTKVAYPSMQRPRLLRRAGGRLDRRRRHARHPDPALDHHGALRDHDRDQHRQAVRRRLPAGAARGAAALRRGAVHLLARPEGRPARPSGRAGASGWRALRERLGGGRAVRRSSMGGIYGGVFTATEGAGVGAFGALRASRSPAARSTGARCSTCWSTAPAPRRCCS